MNKKITRICLFQIQAYAVLLYAMFFATDTKSDIST